MSCGTAWAVFIFFICFIYKGNYHKIINYTIKIKTNEKKFFLLICQVKSEATTVQNVDCAEKQVQAKKKKQNSV